MAPPGRELIVVESLTCVWTLAGVQTDHLWAKTVCSSALTVRVYCDSCHNRNGLEDVRDGNYFHCILQRCSFSGLSVVVFYVAKWLDNRVCSGVADTSPLYRPSQAFKKHSGWNVWWLSLLRER